MKPSGAKKARPVRMFVSYCMEVDHHSVRDRTVRSL
jgi:hypothetical protein